MRNWKTTLLAFVLLQIITECLFTQVEAGGSSGETEQTIEEKIKSSEVVILGNVRYRYNERPSPDGSDYTALMAVYCTIKGPGQPDFVNISEAGIGGTRGFKANLEQAEYYIVFLTGTRRLVPITEPIKKTQKVLDEISSMCSYSGGINIANQSHPIVICPAKQPAPKCKKQKTDINDEKDKSTDDHSNDNDVSNGESEKITDTHAAASKSGCLQIISKSLLTLTISSMLLSTSLPSCYRFLAM